LVLFFKLAALVADSGLFTSPITISLIIIQNPVHPSPKFGLHELGYNSANTGLLIQESEMVMQPTTALTKQGRPVGVEDGKKRAHNNNDKNLLHQTPPPKKKVAKAERASTLCATPPTCIKDKDCHVEYTRKEFLGEVRIDSVDLAKY
jgi:hypothetical protein